MGEDGLAGGVTMAAEDEETEVEVGSVEVAEEEARVVVVVIVIAGFDVSMVSIIVVGGIGSAGWCSAICDCLW